MMDSTASRLVESLKEAVYFLPLSSYKFLVLILLISKGWKADLGATQSVVLNMGPLDGQFSTFINHY